MSKPVIQVTNQTPLNGVYTENLTLEGNRVRPSKSYTDVWEEILVPKGGLEAMLMEGVLYSASIAFTVSVGGWFLIGSMVLVITYTVGGMLAVVMDKSLTYPWYLRMGMLALGFSLSLL